MMIIDNKFSIKEVVYIKTDPEQYPRTINAIEVLPSGLMYVTHTSEGYRVACYDYEITREKILVI